MHKLIITADDYGMCSDVNVAIEECVQAGDVLSVNVMPNMECAEAAGEFRRRFPHVSLGIHFNFTVGIPLADEVPSLTDEEGNFVAYPVLRKRCRRHAYRYDDVVREMQAQYKRFVDICGQPDYWNTHENVHVYPGLYRLIVNEAQKLNITKMRSHQRIYLPASDGRGDKSLKWRMLDPVKRFILNRWQERSEKQGINSPDGIIVRLRESDKLDLEYMFGNIRWKNNEIAEIIIHPSVAAEGRYFGDIGAQRVQEYKAFSSGNVGGIAGKYGIRLTDFKEV